MKISEIRKLLKERNLSNVDVAAATKLHPQTIASFLLGQKTHKSTQLLIEHYVLSISLEKGVS